MWSMQKNIVLREIWMWATQQNIQKWNQQVEVQMWTVNNQLQKIECKQYKIKFNCENFECEHCTRTFNWWKFKFEQWKNHFFENFESGLYKKNNQERKLWMWTMRENTQLRELKCDQCKRAFKFESEQSKKFSQGTVKENITEGNSNVINARSQEWIQ